MSDFVQDIIAAAKNSGATIQHGGFSANYENGLDSAWSRFKVANLSMVIPSVAGGVLGRKGGELLGKMTGMPGIFGDIVGPIVGTSLGMSYGKDMEQRQRQNQTAQYPQMDNTSQDIPLWAQQLASAARPVLKQGSDQASESGLRNMMLENVVGPLGAVHAGYKQNGVQGAVRVGGGTMLGGLAGTALGTVAGKGLEKLMGGEPSLMGIRLPHLLGGLGGVVGGTKIYENLLRG